MDISRRAFLGGAAATAGALAAGSMLQYFMPAQQAVADSGAGSSDPDTTFRTGHSCNCDGVCGHLFHVTDGRVTMVEPAAWGTTTVSGAPVSAFSPRICARGLSQISNTYSPDRIKYPYKRVGDRGSGQWERISWDEATTTIAQAFQAAQAKYGKKSVWIAPYTGSLSLIEGVVGAGYRFANVTGASAGDVEGCNEGDSATPAGMNYVLAADPDQNNGGILDGCEVTDFLNSKAIVFWANNVAETALPDWRVFCDARKNNGTQLIAIDPRFTPTSAGCDTWLPLRPGTDTALVDGLINYVLTNNLYDADYITKYTVGPYLVNPTTKMWLRTGDVIPGAADDYVVYDASDGQLKAASDPSLVTPALLGKYGPMQASTALQALADMASKYTLDYTAQLTDLSAAQIEALAQMWGTVKPLGVRTGFGLSHWYHGDLHMQALLTLQAITGNIGVHGGGVSTFGGGLTTSAFDLADWWNPTGRTDAPYDVLEPMDFCSAVTDGDPFKVSAAWFVIDNFAQQMSDRNKVIAAMKQLDFCVVSDYVLSATCDLADIVLPACTYLEKTDLLSSSNFWLQYMPKIIDPLFESKSDLDAFTMVAQKMGVGQYFDQTPDVYLQQMLRIGQPDADPTVQGLTWDQVTSGTPVHLNTDPLPYQPFFDKQFLTKSGKIEFYVEMLVPFNQQLCDHQEPVEASPTNALYQKYPLVFLSTHTRFRTHSQYVNLPWLKEINNGGMGFLEINPKDAAPRGIKNGAVVRIYNDRGEMKVNARLTESIKPGVVNCYQGGWTTVNVNHYIEGNPNNLTHQLKKPAQALIPNFQSNAAYFDCLVQVETA